MTCVLRFQQQNLIVQQVILSAQIQFPLVTVQAVVQHLIVSYVLTLMVYVDTQPAALILAGIRHIMMELIVGRINGVILLPVWFLIVMRITTAIIQPLQHSVRVAVFNQLSVTIVMILVRPVILGRQVGRCVQMG